jgi:putative serine protease PepD
MSQTTNDHDDNGYAWARQPGSSSETTGSNAPTTPFAAPDGGAWAGPTSQPSQTSDTTSVAAGPVDATPSPDDAPAASPPVSPSATYPPPVYGASNSPTFGPAGDALTPGSSWGAQPPTPPKSGRRFPRQPGWGGVVATGVGAAVLASLLTGLVVSHDQNDNAALSTTASNSSQSAVKAPVTSSNSGSPNWNAVATAVEPSVVSVQVTGQNSEGEGSGVILDKTGRIVTNNHVVNGVGSNATIEVVLSDGRKYGASVVGTDSATDLAVIKLSDPPSDLTPATLGASNSVSVGDPVMAVGNPLGLAGTVTTGIVSATDRPTTTQQTSNSQSNNPFQQSSAGNADPVVTNAIQTDAAVNPGNSGGALVNAQGLVIGVPSSIASLSDGSDLNGESSESGNIGLGFAIPVDEVKEVTSQLIQGKTVQHSWLGVGTQDGTVKVNGASRDAAVLKTVEKGSPAQKAGLKANDAVIAVNGETVNGYLSLVGQLRERPVNSQVTLTVVRNSKTQLIKVTLGAAPTSTN